VEIGDSIAGLLVHSRPLGDITKGRLIALSVSQGINKDVFQKTNYSRLRMYFRRKIIADSIAHEQSCP
jgi:hypothetical protein